MTTSRDMPVVSFAEDAADPREPGVLQEIRRGSALAWLDLTQLWHHRELLFFLTWRDVKVRYKQTFLGVLWAVLQPLITMLIFSLLFGRLAGMGDRTGGIPYPIYVFAGLLPWLFFANSVTNS